MNSRRIILFLGFCVCFARGIDAQDTPPKVTDPKTDPSQQKYRGQLPFYWKELGLTDVQRQQVYKINAEYGEQIEALEAKIKLLKEKRDKERLQILTPEQKKRLEEILRKKSGG